MTSSAAQQKKSETNDQNTGTMVFTSSIHRLRRGNGHAFTADNPSKPRVPTRKPARVARMLAFAHKLQEAIDNGEYTDRADAARKLGLTRARVSQLMDLLMLAPDLQEKILFMERVDGLEPTSERALRRVVVGQANWRVQRRRWVEIIPSHGNYQDKLHICPHLCP